MICLSGITFLAAFREEFMFSYSLTSMVLPESVRIFWLFVNAWLWAGFMVGDITV